PLQLHDLFARLRCASTGSESRDAVATARGDHRSRDDRNPRRHESRLALMTVMWVFLAGGLGSATRYVIGLWAATTFGVAFPYGTLIVNLAGCFALGLVVQLAV